MYGTNTDLEDRKRGECIPVTLVRPGGVSTTVVPIRDSDQAIGNISVLANGLTTTETIHATI
jgi:hypothetical protein